MMKTVIYCGTSGNERSRRKLKLKLPNYLIRRKISTIREKIMARKYATIYLVKVFGKYHPSECRRYYNKKMLRKFFDKLKAHWFDEKLVYRLLDKANIFFRQKLIGKTFVRWHSYAAKAKTVKQQAQIVRCNHEDKLLRTISHDWNAVTKCRKKYKLIRNSAMELYFAMYALLALLKLGKWYSDEIEENLFEMKSISFGRCIILRKYTRKWKIYVFQQRNQRALERKATSYYKAKLSSFYFLHWQRYVSYKITKCEIVQLCTGLYEDGLLKSAVRFWRNKNEFQIIDKKNKLIAVGFYEDLIKRKLLKTWMRYVKHKLVGRNLKHKAIFFYKMRLKVNVLDALLKHVEICKNSRLAVKKLGLFYRRLLIITVWNKWSEIIDEKHDSDLRNKLLLAKKFYSENIGRKYLAKLMTYKITQGRKKSLKLKATDLCKAFYCGKYLNVWRTENAEKKRLAMLEEKALQFFNHALIYNSIGRWIRSYNCKISMKAKDEKAALHHDRKIIGKCFASWINFCNERIRAANLVCEVTEYYLEMLQRRIFKKLSLNVARMKMKREKVQAAVKFYEKNLVIEAFENWRKHCFRVSELRIKVEEFDKSMRNKLSQKMIVQWRLYVHCKKCSRRKILMSVSHRRKKTCLKIFEQLKKYVNYKKEKDVRLSYLNYGVGRIKENVKTIYFQKWRCTRLNVLKEKCKMFHADEFYATHLKKKSFFTWKTFLTQHKTKRQHQCNLNNVMNHFVLKKYLKVWYTRYQVLLQNHFNERSVSKIYEMKIVYKYFIAWKYFTEICTRERKEINNAKELHKKLVVKEGLQHLVKLYLCDTELRFQTHLRNIERNSSHEFELLKKYFSKWHKAVSAKSKNPLHAVRDQTSFENVIVTSAKNNRKYICNLMPRFVIPEFMKDEIKLRFGIGRCANKIPLNVSGAEMRQRSRVLRADQSSAPPKSSHNVLHSQLHGISRENKDPSCPSPENQVKVKNKSKEYGRKSQNSLLKTIKESHILSTDSLKSDSESAKTYTVENPRYSWNSNKENLLLTANRYGLAAKEHNITSRDA